MIMRPQLALVVVVTIAACGLVSSDVTNVSLALPSHAFHLDTADWHLSGTGTVPEIPCGSSCDAVATQICSPGVCSVSCNQDTTLCAGKVVITLVNDYDLAHEAPELEQFTGRTSISVTLDDVWFQIDENTLNVDTPPLTIYIAPMSAAAPGDPGVVIVGTIPAVTAHTTGRVDVAFAGGGKDAVKRFIDDYKSPFRILVSGAATVEGGQPVPAGRMVGTVQAKAHAGLN